MMASFKGLLIVASGCERKTRMIFSKKRLRSLFGVLGDDVLVPGRMWVVWLWYYQNFTSVLVLFFFHLIFASCVDSYQSEQEIVQRALWFLRMECGTQLCAHPVGCVSYWSVE